MNVPPGTVPLNLNLDAELKDVLVAEAKRRRSTVTAIVHEALREFLAERCDKCGSKTHKP